MSLYVDKKNANGIYMAFGTHYFNNDIKTSPKKWAMYDFKFTEEGDFRISVIGKADDALAVTYIIIGFMEEKDDARKK